MMLRKASDYKIKIQENLEHIKKAHSERCKKAKTALSDAMKVVKDKVSGHMEIL